MYLFIKQLSLDLQFEAEPELDKENAYSLTITPELSLSVKELKPGWLLSARIGAFPTNEIETFLIHAMLGNLFGQGMMADSVLGLDHTGKVLTLALAVPLVMNYGDFKKYLENFVNDLEFWKNETADHVKGITTKKTVLTAGRFYQ